MTGSGLPMVGEAQVCVGVLEAVCMPLLRVGWDYPGARSLNWTPQEGLAFLSPCLPTYFHV